jgi:excisionase family DNA binding protein
VTGIPYSVSQIEPAEWQAVPGEPAFEGVESRRLFRLLQCALCVSLLERLVDERVAAVLAHRSAESEPVWLSLSEAAEYLRVSPRTIARLREQGRLRVSHVGRRVLVNRADLDAAQ